MTVAEFRPWFDERFEVLLEQKIAAFTGHSSSVDVARIATYARTLATGGKRFRPFLTYSASGLDFESVGAHFDILAAIELLHVFALIHDDIMDNATTRHGVVCAHQYFAEEYGGPTATAIAILLGDVVLTWAYDCLFAYTSTYPHLRDAISAEFASLVAEVTHGQLLDVLSPVQTQLTYENIVEKMVLKTARYTFVRPLRLGAIVGGTIDQDSAFIEGFGTALGVGFQLQDDLLDFGDAQQSGKSAFVDVGSRQQTVLSWFMYTHAKPVDRQVFDTYFGAGTVPLDAHDTLRHACADAITFVTTETERYFTTARSLTTDRHDAAQWTALIDTVRGRTH